MTWLVFPPKGRIGLRDSPCPWSFEIPAGVDRYQVLREARDATSYLYRILKLQVALMAEASSIDRSPLDAELDEEPEIADTMLALGRREIAEAMRSVEAAGYDARSVAVLRAGLLPLTFDLFGWTLLRRRAGGERHVVGFWGRHERDRSSSPIRSFDRATMTATTSSGNRYELIGDPSEDRLEDVRVRRWLARHELSRNDVEIIEVEGLVMRYVLRSWCIFRAPSGEVHLNGLSVFSCERPVSSPVRSFDAATRTAVTASGNVYELKAELGFHPDAWWVRREWLHRNGLLETDVVPIGADHLRPTTEDGT